MPPNSPQWATRSTHLNRCADRALVRRRASAMQTAGLWLQVDEEAEITASIFRAEADRLDTDQGNPTSIPPRPNLKERLKNLAL